MHKQVPAAALHELLPQGRPVIPGAEYQCRRQQIVQIVGSFENRGDFRMDARDRLGLELANRGQFGR